MRLLLLLLLVLVLQRLGWQTGWQAGMGRQAKANAHDDDTHRWMAAAHTLASCCIVRIIGLPLSPPIVPLDCGELPQTRLAFDSLEQKSSKIKNEAHPPKST